MRKVFGVLVSLLALGGLVWALANFEIITGKGISVTLNDLKLLLAGMNEGERETLLSDPFKLTKYIKFMAEVEVFSKEARKTGLQNDPVVKKKIEFAVKSVLAKEFLRRELERRMKDFKLSDSELLLYYNTHKDEFRTKEGVQSFEKVKNIIADRLKEEYRKNLIKTLVEEGLERYNVKIHSEILEKLKDS